MNVTEHARPTTKPLPKSLRINRIEPPKCAFCGSTNILYLVNYTDRAKDSHWPRNGKEGFGLCLRACKDHPLVVASKLLIQEGALPDLITADPERSEDEA